MRSHNNWALYSTTPFTGPEICRVTFVSDFRCIQKARRKKVFVCCKDSIHKIVHSFVSSVSNCRCPRVLYSPLLLPLTDHPLPFIAPPQFLQEYLVCVISFLSLLDDYDIYHLSSLFMSQFYSSHKLRDGRQIKQKLFGLSASAKQLKTHL
jgi:hypothetical protein